MYPTAESTVLMYIVLSQGLNRKSVVGFSRMISYSSGKQVPYFSIRKCYSPPIRSTILHQSEEDNHDRDSHYAGSVSATTFSLRTKLPKIAGSSSINIKGLTAQSSVDLDVTL